MSLDTALAFSLREEGGYVNNPNDSGGATNHGITQHTYDSYRASLKLPHQDVQLITDADVRTIYEQMYWIPGKCPLMHEPIATTHMDWCINHGVSGAITTLQQALGVKADGVFGAQTAGELAIADATEISITYNQLRRAWYKQRVIDKPNQAEFLAGWLGRVDRLEAYCESL